MKLLLDTNALIRWHAGRLSPAAVRTVRRAGLVAVSAVSETAAAGRVTTTGCPLSPAAATRAVPTSTREHTAPAAAPRAAEEPATEPAASVEDDEQNTEPEAPKPVPMS